MPDFSYLKNSKNECDQGNLIGRLPTELSVHEIDALNPKRTPISAIRAHCIECSGGSVGEARKCTAYNCRLWMHRMGFNPFHGNSR